MSLTPAHLIFLGGEIQHTQKKHDMPYQEQEKKRGRETNGTLWKKQNGASVCLFLITQ